MGEDDEIEEEAVEAQHEPASAPSSLMRNRERLQEREEDPVGHAFDEMDQRVPDPPYNEEEDELNDQYSDEN